jgi:hypothetical protein
MRAEGRSSICSRSIFSLILGSSGSNTEAVLLENWNNGATSASVLQAMVRQDPDNDEGSHQKK